MEINFQGIKYPHVLAQKLIILNLNKRFPYGKIIF